MLYFISVRVPWMYFKSLTLSAVRGQTPCKSINIQDSAQGCNPVTQRENLGWFWLSDTTCPLPSHLTTIYHGCSQEKGATFSFVQQPVCTCHLIAKIWACFGFCQCNVTIVEENNQFIRKYFPVLHALHNEVILLPSWKHQLQFDATASKHALK